MSIVCVLCAGKSNPYCEVTMGSQCHVTKTLQDTLNPKWNSNCQFFIKDLEQDVLCVTVFERDQFSPDGQYTHSLTHVYCMYALTCNQTYQNVYLLLCGISKIFYI